jgi:hypothetical protein
LCRFGRRARRRGPGAMIRRRVPPTFPKSPMKTRGRAAWNNHHLKREHKDARRGCHARLSKRLGIPRCTKKAITRLSGHERRSRIDSTRSVLPPIRTISPTPLDVGLPETWLVRSSCGTHRFDVGLGHLRSGFDRNALSLPLRSGCSCSARSGSSPRESTTRPIH